MNTIQKYIQLSELKNLMFFGVAFIVLAIISALHPAKSLSLIFTIYGAFLVARGIFSFSGIKLIEKGKKWMLIISALLTILAGIFIFIYPVIYASLSLTTLSFIIAIILIVDGVLLFKYSKKMSILEIALGAITFLSALFAPVTFVWMMSAFFMFAGLVLVSTAGAEESKTYKELLEK